MPNLSQIKRQRMLDFLETLRKEHTDDESIRAFTEIENHLRDKKYGLVWEEHSERVDEMLEENIPIFTEDADKKITTSADGAYNFILEGDNLQSLYLLQKTHTGRIDFIYIDPPYNTGNKDFVYNDKYIDSLDGFRHSKWLSFMNVRLRIAKKLLSPKGIIFISIDDNEQSTLKLLCDEIFGEDYFAGGIIVKSNPRGSQSKKEIAGLHEFILVYTNNGGKAPIIGHALTDEMSSEYKYSDSQGSYRLLGLRQRGGFWRASERPNLFYPFYVNPDTLEISLQKTNGFSEEVYPYQPSSGEKGTWRWSKEKVQTDGDVLLARKVKRNGETVYDIYQKDYLNGNHGKERRTKAKSIWDEKEMNYQNAATELKAIFGTSPFTYAKPTYLVKQALRMMDYGKKETVLDFFAGSRTTAQAVLELNNEDGGKRTVILCTNNEGDICTDITYPRTKTIITGITPTGEDYSDGILANLKYFKCDWTPRKPEDYLLSNVLCLHIREMIELQNSIEVDNVKNVLILNKEDFRKYVLDDEAYAQIENIWVNQNIIFNSAEMEKLNTLGFKYIPREFFGQELKEAAE